MEKQAHDHLNKDTHYSTGTCYVTKLHNCSPEAHRDISSKASSYF